MWSAYRSKAATKICFTRSEKGLSGLGWRTPNIAGNPAHYIGQVKTSSVLENSIRTAAKDMTDLILEYFSDEDGKVRAVEYSNLVGSILK